MPQFDKVKSDFVKKYYRQPVTILWSGGLDSNCLLLMAIEADCDIRLIIVDSDQLPNRRAEERNRDMALNKLADKHPDAIIKTTYIQSPTMSGHFHLNQMQMWLSAAVLLPTHGTLMIGYVCGDEAISFLSELQRAWNAANFNRIDNFPLTFPLAKVTKGEFMRYVGDTLKFMSIYCEHPQAVGDIWTRCNKCPSCRRMGDNANVMIDLDNHNGMMCSFIEQNSKYEWKLVEDDTNTRFMPDMKSVTEDMLSKLDAPHPK